MGKNVNKKKEETKKPEVKKEEIKEVKKPEVKKPTLKKGMVKIHSKVGFTILLDHNIYCKKKCKCKTVKINRRDRKGKIKKTETKRLPDSKHINFGINIVSELILNEPVVKAYMKQGLITKRK